MNGSILIPEKFKLNGNAIKVAIDDEYCNDKEYYGAAHFAERMITLCNVYQGKKIRKSVKEKTFFHELVHMILNSMGRDRLKWDENFVEDFANRLYEYEKSKQ